MLPHQWDDAVNDTLAPLYFSVYETETDFEFTNILTNITCSKQGLPIYIVLQGIIYKNKILTVCWVSSK